MSQHPPKEELHNRLWANLALKGSSIVAKAGRPRLAIAHRGGSLGIASTDGIVKILGKFHWGNIRVILVLYWDNGKQNGNYSIGGPEFESSGSLFLLCGAYLAGVHHDVG